MVISSNAVGAVMAAAILSASAVSCSTHTGDGAADTPSLTVAVPPAARSTAAPQTVVDITSSIHCAITDEFVACASSSPFGSQTDGKPQVSTYLATLGKLPEGKHLSGEQIDPTQLQPGDLIAGADTFGVVISTTPEVTVGNETGVSAKYEGGAGLRLPAGEPLATHLAPAQPVRGWELRQVDSGAVVIVPAQGVVKHTPALGLSIFPA